MKKTLVAKGVFRFLIILFLIFFISACLKTTSPPTRNLNNQPVLTPEELESQYESSLKGILGSYQTIDDVASSKDQILALRAPAKYLDLHFNLVVALELIEQGQQTANQTKINDGSSRVAELKKDYNWLN